MNEGEIILYGSGSRTIKIYATEWMVSKGIYFGIKDWLEHQKVLVATTRLTTSEVAREFGITYVNPETIIEFEIAYSDNEGEDRIMD